MGAHKLEELTDTTYEHWYLIGGDFGYHTSSNNLVLYGQKNVERHRQEHLGTSNLQAKEHPVFLLHFE